MIPDLAITLLPLPSSASILSRIGIDSVSGSGSGIGRGLELSSMFMPLLHGCRSSGNVCTLQVLGCSAETTERMRETCGAGSRGDRSLLSRQFLFTVYNHPSPEFLGFPRGSLFHGREVANRVAVRARV